MYALYKCAQTFELAKVCTSMKLGRRSELEHHTLCEVLYVNRGKAPNLPKHIN